MNLLVRVVAGAVLAAITAACVWFGEPWLEILIGVAAVAVCWEFTTICTGFGARPFEWLLVPVAVWWAERFYTGDSFGGASFNVVDEGFAVLIVGGALAMVILAAPAARWFSTIAGAAYIGLCLGYFVALSRSPGAVDHYGAKLILVTLAGPIAGDTAAYFVGSAIGKHRFFPDISPKKSVEGAIASLIATVAVMTALVCLVLSMPLWKGAILGLLISVAAQGGDLAESKLKREGGVKDSGRLVPGHGGLLDRLDSILIVAPVMYWWLQVAAS